MTLKLLFIWNTLCRIFYFFQSFVTLTFWSNVLSNVPHSGSDCLTRQLAKSAAHVHTDTTPLCLGFLKSIHWEIVQKKKIFLKNLQLWTLLLRKNPRTCGNSGYVSSWLQTAGAEVQWGPSWIATWCGLTEATLPHQWPPWPRSRGGTEGPCLPEALTSLRMRAITDVSWYSKADKNWPTSAQGRSYGPSPKCGPGKGTWGQSKMPQRTSGHPSNCFQNNSDVSSSNCVQHAWNASDSPQGTWPTFNRRGSPREMRQNKSREYLALDVTKTPHHLISVPRIFNIISNSKPQRRHPKSTSRDSRTTKQSQKIIGIKGSAP